MTSIKLKFVDRFTDRHGKARYYFRRRGGKRVALRGEPGSAEFMESYQSALDDLRGAMRDRGTPGSFERLIALYFASPEFLSLKTSTRRAYHRVMERFEKEHGRRLVREMRREHVKTIIAGRAETPAAANDLLKKIRILVHFAIDCGWRTDDPTLRMKKFPAGEWHTWTDAEIEQFEQHWPIGTRERTAFALHLYTGQRLSDVCRMGWPDIEGHFIRVAQVKGGAKLSVPLHLELRRILDAWHRSHVAILVTAYGRPFTPDGYGNWFADVIDKAALPERCVTHGLRKAAARRLAEAGCSANEIAAVTGHKSLQEVERYTRAADQKHLASAAMLRLQSKTEK